MDFFSDARSDTQGDASLSDRNNVVRVRRNLGTKESRMSSEYKRNSELSHSRTYVLSSDQQAIGASNYPGEEPISGSMVIIRSYLFYLFIL